MPNHIASPSRLFHSNSKLREWSPGNIWAILWRQWRTERALARRGVHFRSADPHRCAAAYAAMAPDEFDAVNGRQAWANWRTIPRSFNGNVPNRPLRILDLGCGTGSSTRVLARLAPPQSHITGIEQIGTLVAIARTRSYPSHDGQDARVDFTCQPLTEHWCEPDGLPVAAQSADVVNASGVVGHHFNAHSVMPIIAELRRVLRPGAMAMLDVGPTLTEPALSGILQSSGFRKLGRRRSWRFDPTGQVAFVRDDGIL